MKVYKSVSAVLLAAGESRRMGRPKQLLPIGDRTAIEMAIENLLASPVSEVIVVLGYKANEIAERISYLPVKIVINTDYTRGMSSSVKAGLKAVSDMAEGVLFAHGDQPFVTPMVIDKLVSAFSQGAFIVLPIYQGKTGHPVILDIKYRQDILEMDEGLGLRQVIRKYSDDIQRVEVDSPAVLMDMDEMKEYHRQLEQFGFPSISALFGKQE